MKTKVITLKENIENNIDYLIMEYSTVDSVLTDLNMILEMKMTDDKIDEWFELNSYIIKTINEILERQNSK